MLHEPTPASPAPVHAVPSAAFGFEQMPVPEAQVPTTWHESMAVQTTGVAPVHVPTWQVSTVVHALLSLQAAPFPFAGFEHTPVPALQAPAV